MHCSKTFENFPPKKKLNKEQTKNKNKERNQEAKHISPRLPSFCMVTSPMLI